jgi:SAM-dependent methyltransferase
MTYDDPTAWRRGPHLVYRRFASAALDALNHPVAGLSTVDVGSGTGAMGEELVARGARVVSADLQLAMVRDAPGPRLVCDVTSLALADRCTELATAGFVLSHVDRPDVALRELARITRAGGMIMATAFPAGDRHPVKHAVDVALADVGYQVPGWYQRLKGVGEQRVGDPAALVALARAAGLRPVAIWHLDVPLADLGPEVIVAWRLGMPAVSAFVARLPVRDRDELTALARGALSRTVLSEPVRMLVLAAAVG